MTAITFMIIYVENKTNTNTILTIYEWVNGIQ